MDQWVSKNKLFFFYTINILCVYNEKNRYMITCYIWYYGPGTRQT